MPSYVEQDDYLASGYVDGAYVGSDSDLYVESGYFQDAIEGVATVSAVASITVSGGLLQSSDSTLTSAFTTSIDATVKRDGTSSSDSAVSVLLDAIATRSAEISISSSATTSQSNVITRNANIDITTNVSTTQSNVITRSAVISTISAGTTSITANAIVSPGGDINVSASTETDAIATKVGVIDIQAFQTHPTLWGDNFTWDNPVGTIWGPMVEVNVVGIVRGESSISSNFTLTADGDRTAVANIAPAAVATVEVYGNAEIIARPDTISSSVSVDVEGILNAEIRNFELTAAATVEVSGIFQVAGYPTAIGGELTITADGDVVRSADIDITSSTTVDSQFGRIRPYTANISSAFTLTSDADSKIDGISIVTSAGTLDITAFKTTDADIDINSAVTLPRWVGGKLFGGIIDINAFATTVSALTLYNIDPYRVYVVDSETRLLGITQETRIYTANSETRVNSIQAETRLFKVPSETRTLEVQTLELVELPGIKDRRT